MIKIQKLKKILSYLKYTPLIPFVGLFVGSLYFKFIHKNKKQFSQSDAEYVILKDGRRLAYQIYGDKTQNERVVIYHHGYPDCRYDCIVADRIFKEMQVKLIGFDRPGFGRSDFQPNRKIVDIVDDTLALADHLNIKQFVTYGQSGGGPYATACAARMTPDRCICAINIVGVGAIDQIINPLENMRILNKILFYLPGYISANIIFLMNQFSPQEFTDEQIKQLFPIWEQKSFFTTPEMRTTLPKVLPEALQAGYQGLILEHDLFSHYEKWGFKLEEIQNSQVKFKLLYGQLDRQVPKSHYQWYKDNTQCKNAILYENTGHFWNFANPEEFKKQILQCFIESNI